MRKIFLLAIILVFLGKSSYAAPDPKIVDVTKSDVFELWNSKMRSCSGENGVPIIWVGPPPQNFKDNAKSAKNSLHEISLLTGVPFVIEESGIAFISTDFAKKSPEIVVGRSGQDMKDQADSIDSLSIDALSIMPTGNMVADSLNSKMFGTDEKQIENFLRKIVSFEDLKIDIKKNIDGQEYEVKGLLSEMPSDALRVSQSYYLESNFVGGLGEEIQNEQSIDYSDDYFTTPINPRNSYKKDEVKAFSGQLGAMIKSLGIADNFSHGMDDLQIYVFYKDKEEDVNKLIVDSLFIDVRSIADASYAAFGMDNISMYTYILTQKYRVAKNGFALSLKNFLAKENKIIKFSSLSEKIQTSLLESVSQQYEDGKIPQQVASKINSSAVRFSLVIDTNVFIGLKSKINERIVKMSHITFPLYSVWRAND